VAQKYDIPSELPLTLLEGVLMDIDTCRYNTFDALYTYCYRVAGVVGVMMTYVLGHHDTAAFRHAEQLGVAMQLTNILRDIDEDQQMGRIYLPYSEMSRFGVDERDIMERNMTEDLRQLMKFQVNRAHQYYEEADAGIPMLNRESQFTIRAASRIYRGILHRIETNAYNPFLGRVFVPQGRKVGIILAEVLRTRLPSFSSIRVGAWRTYNP
jgi:phytoene synthase